MCIQLRYQILFHPYCDLCKEALWPHFTDEKTETQGAKFLAIRYLTTK